MQRMAGENEALSRLQAQVERDRREMFAKVKRNSNEQIRRDIAAAYGQIIPFD